MVVHGSIAPLIELGAGFDMDLTARENIYLNGTVLGLTPKYIDEKFDEIVDFSELREFLDVPLKNYSSGMVARIAFAIARSPSRTYSLRTRYCPWVTSCFRKNARSACAS